MWMVWKETESEEEKKDQPNCEEKICGTEAEQILDGSCDGTSGNGIKEMLNI